MQFVSVILPLKLPWCPVYSSEDNLEAGERVWVKFAGRDYDGVVWRTGVEPSVSPDKVSPISAKCTGLARITAEELRFWEFISDYYLCTIGEVFKSAYPGYRRKSEKTAISLQGKAESSIARKQRTLERRIEILRERLESRKQALKERLSGEQTSSRFRKDSGITLKLKASVEKVQEDLRAAESAYESLKASRAASPDVAEAQHPNSKPTAKPLVLVSSNRTATYIRSIRKTLDEGKQILVLTPEKAFMSRLLSVIEDNFPGKVLKYTSDDTTAARRKVSERVRRDSMIVVGTRSALFLPYHNLGLIIIDEEQDTFYKQTEPNPRYHGRDAAMALAAIHGSDAILGTEAPSLETWFNCNTGKYRMEYEPILTNVLTIDINSERRKNGMLGPVSRKLLEAIAKTSGSTVIIRGWENPEDLNFSRLCPGKTVHVMTMQDLKSKGPGDATLIGLLQADAFVAKDDFRADERASQMVAQMSYLAPEVVIQTSNPERFSGGRAPADLLAERKTFRYPPFTRIVDVNIEDRYERRLSFVCSRLSEMLEATCVSTGPESRKFRLFLERNASLAEKKSDIVQKVSQVQKDFCCPGHIIIDVDPQ